MIIISEVTLFSYRRLTAVEEEMKTAQRGLDLLSIKMNSAYRLWRDLEEAAFQSEAKTAHWEWTKLQHDHLQLEREVKRIQERFFGFASKQAEEAASK